MTTMALNIFKDIYTYVFPPEDYFPVYDRYQGEEVGSRILFAKFRSHPAIKITSFLGLPNSYQLTQFRDSGDQIKAGVLVKNFFLLAS
jgi:hypothetical protein